VSASTSSEAATEGAGATYVPMLAIRTGDGPLFGVDIYIDGRGPYGFVVDSGAASSVIVPAMANRLNLPSVGDKQEIGGVDCTASASQRRVEHWSMGGMLLKPEVIQSQALAGFGGYGEPVGLLGADVLRRFGAVRFNFAPSELVLPGPESREPSKSSQLQGPSKPPVPADLAGGSPTVVPLDVQTGSESALAVVSVTLGSSKGAFVIDTGASRSLISPGLAQSAGLKSTGEKETGSSACGSLDSSVVGTGRWSVGSVPLASGILLSQGGLPNGIDGIIGADQLSRFRFVILAFKSEELLLGPPGSSAL
jgi:predicted aspartyl protease